MEGKFDFRSIYDSPILNCKRKQPKCSTPQKRIRKEASQPVSSSTSYSDDSSDSRFDRLLGLTMKRLNFDQVIEERQETQQDKLKSEIIGIKLMADLENESFVESLARESNVLLSLSIFLVDLVRTLVLDRHLHVTSTEIIYNRSELKLPLVEFGLLGNSLSLKRENGDFCLEFEGEARNSSPCFVRNLKASCVFSFNESRIKNSMDVSEFVRIDRLAFF